MASKSRFGYFSILPSHTAAITDYAQKTGIFQIIIQPIKMTQEKSPFRPEESTLAQSQLKCLVKPASHKSKALLLVVHMSIQIDQKGKGS